jgi:hypothetical protein
MKGHLATINSEEEAELIKKNFPQAWGAHTSPYGAGYWLGGFQPPGSTEPNGEDSGLSMRSLASGSGSPVNLTLTWGMKMALYGGIPGVLLKLVIME